MMILRRETRVRHELLLAATRSAKAAMIQLRRLSKIGRSSPGSDTGKTGVKIAAVDLSMNRENEMNEARVARPDRRGKKQPRCTGDEAKNLDNENLENELREFLTELTGEAAKRLRNLDG